MKERGEEEEERYKVATKKWTAGSVVSCNLDGCEMKRLLHQPNKSVSETKWIRKANDAAREELYWRVNR